MFDLLVVFFGFLGFVVILFIIATIIGDNPILILNELLAMEGNIALDPAVSKEARELYLKGWKEGMKQAQNIAANMPSPDHNTAYHLGCRDCEIQIRYELENSQPKIEKEVDISFP